MKWLFIIVYFVLNFLLKCSSSMKDPIFRMIDYVFLHWKYFARVIISTLKLWRVNKCFFNPLLIYEWTIISTFNFELWLIINIGLYLVLLQIPTSNITKNNEHVEYNKKRAKMARSWFQTFIHDTLGWPLHQYSKV
jgi:hypothetical protein